MKNYRSTGVAGLGFKPILFRLHPFIRSKLTPPKGDFHMSNIVIRKRFLATMFYVGAFILPVFVVLNGGGSASAQSVYGSIVGTATDSTGSAVPGAGLTLTNLGTNEARTAQ